MKKALLIIDVQNFYFEEGPSRLYEPEKAARQIEKVLAHFRKTNQTVIHIQHIGKENMGKEANNPSLAIHDSVAPIDGEIVIKKAYPSGFRETNLKEVLDELQVEELVIVGMMSHMCVDTTVRAASNYGYTITVLHDCCTTKSLIFQDITIEAVTVHKAFMASFEGFFAKVCGTQEYLDSLDNLLE